MKTPLTNNVSHWMKRILITCLLLVFFTGFSFAQSTHKTILLVRHAEKADDVAGDRNPDLNEDGLARAEHLGKMLSEAGIKFIYSTDFKRTVGTGEPLAKLLGISITKYNPRESGVLQKIISESGNSPVLIIGHSNTVPEMVNELIGSKKFPFLEETEYDKLFIVSFFEGDSDCIVLKY